MQWPAWFSRHADRHRRGGPDPVSIIVEEADGSPSAKHVNKIIVTAGDLTDNGDGSVLLATGGGGGGAPTTADYLVGTANGGLTAEIVVGTTPGGELGGTWPSPTVDSSHADGPHWVMKAATELTIATGVITVTQEHHIVRGEGGLDDVLTTINGGVANKWLLLRGNASENIAVGSGGNIQIPTDRLVMYLSGADSAILLVYDAATTTWIARSLTNAPQKMTDEADATMATATSLLGAGMFIMSSAIRLRFGVGSIGADKLSGSGINSQLWELQPQSGSADDLVSIDLEIGDTNATMGDFLIVYAQTGTTITLKHDNAGGTAGFKLFCTDDADIVLDGDGKAALLMYDDALDSAAGGWRTVSLGGSSVVPGTTVGLWPVMNAATELTIASGEITLTQDHHTLASESGTSDDLTIINGGIADKFLMLRGKDSHTITVFGLGADNILIPFMQSGIVVLRSALDFLLLMSDETGTFWTGVASSQGPDAINSLTLPVAYATEDHLKTVLQELNTTEYTISSDQVTTITTSYAKLDTESAAGSDDLDGLSTTDTKSNGMWVIISPVNDAHTIVIKHNNAGGSSGNKIFCQGGTDITLDDLHDFALLVYNTTLDSGNGGWMAGLIGGGGGGVSFDDATSDPLIDADSAADGTENSAARKDHVHPKHHARSHGVDGGSDHSYTGITQAMRIPGMAFWPAIHDSVPGSAARFDSGSNDRAFFGVSFPIDVDKYAAYQFSFPSNWNNGTVTVRFKWTAESGTGDVVWGAQMVAVSEGDPLNATMGTAQTVTDSVTTAGDVHVTAATSALTIGGTPAADDLILLEVYHNGTAGGDTISAAPILMEVVIVYTITGMTQA